MKASPRTSLQVLVALALALTSGQIAGAADGASCWALRGIIARVDTDNQLFLDLGNERRNSFLTAGTGLGLSYEYRRGCRWGFEAGLLTAELNSLFIYDSVRPAFWGKDHDDVAFTALTLGPTFHLTPWRRADLYVGPLLALTDFAAGNYLPPDMLDPAMRTGPVFRQEFDADPAWGFQAGLDLPLRRGSPWALHVGARYLDLEVDAGDAAAGTLDVNPTIWSAGISYSPGGCRGACEEVDECTGLLRRLDELGDCRVCPAGQECLPEDPCASCEGTDCLECPGRSCEELCPTCPEGQQCRSEPLTCDDLPEECRASCPQGEACRGECPEPPRCPDCRELGCPGPDCPTGTQCRPGWPCAGCEGAECIDCLGLECADLCPPRCEECPIPPPPPCPDGQLCRDEQLSCAEFPDDCRICPPGSWGLCCLILAGLVSLWLIWWVFRRQRLPMTWFWLGMVPLVFLIGKLWFFRSAAGEAWLLIWLAVALVLTLLFAVLRLLVRKRWIALLLAGLLALVTLALGQLAGWSWFWWFLLVALALLVIGLVWRSAREDRHGLVRLILLAVLLLVLLLLGPLAGWAGTWRVLAIVLAVVLVAGMARWARRAGAAGTAEQWITGLALSGAVVYAGLQAASGWFWWFLAVLAAALVIYLLRHWLGDRRRCWPALVAVLILILLPLGKLAGWNWLWWFLLAGLVVLLVCLLWRRAAGREGGDPPGLWLIPIVLMVLVLLALGNAAGYGWLWWLLLSGLLLPGLWLLWRLLGGGLGAACGVLAAPVLLMLFWLGKIAGWAWLGWLALAAAALLLLYVLLRALGWGREPDDRPRLWLCLLVLAILTLFCLGPLAGWSAHWWLALLALVLTLAGVAWRLIGGGGAAGLAQLVWLGLLLIAIVLMLLLSAGGEPAWLAAVLTCTLLALLPLALWSLWAHTAGGSPIGVACAAGLAPLRKLQAGLGPIDKADPAAVRELFLAYRDRRGWADMYALYERMPDELSEDLEIRQQLAFALNRDGRDRQAEELLTGLESDAERGAESWGLLGRIYKDRWDVARKLSASSSSAGDAGKLLERAIRAYVAGHEAGDRRNPYPGINALTLAEFLGDRRRELADRLPGELDAALDAAEPADSSDYWHHATRLELAVHQGDESASRQALARAIEAAKPSPTACPQVWKVETTCRNLRLLAEGRSDRDEPLPPWSNELIAELESAGAGDPPSDDPGTALARFFDFRDRQAWAELYALVGSMPPTLAARTEVRQQHAFALNRDGRDQQAESLLAALRQEEGPSAETCGLLGRIHKDRWDDARRGGDDAAAAEHLERAIGAYLEGHETGEDNPYPGINALTLAEFSDARRSELRQRLLGELAAFLDRSAIQDYWHQATRLELAAHREDEGEGRAALSLAVEALADAGPSAVWMSETTRRNLRLIEEARRERDAEPLAWLGAAIDELGLR